MIFRNWNNIHLVHNSFRIAICDDAPQFKLITDDLALCWIHEGRHYKKLSPFIACHQKILDNFLEQFWEYYRRLLAYRYSPCEEKAHELRSEFWKLFSKETGYFELDELKQLTAAKVEELLLVLEHPELPLHNNPAELAARTMVQRRNIPKLNKVLKLGIFLCLLLTLSRSA